MGPVSGRPVTASVETDRNTWNTVYVSNVFAASADWRTGAAAASWRLTLAAWISAERASGGTASGSTGAEVTTGWAVASGDVVSTGAGRAASAAATAAATRALISASRDRLLPSSAAPPAAPPTARPTTSPIATNVEALLS